MINLELQYLGDICSVLFTIDKELKEVYGEYIKNNILYVKPDFSCNDVEHNKFLKERLLNLQSHLYLNKGEYKSIFDYKRLTSLLQYMYQIKSMSKTQEKVQLNKYSIPDLIGFEFCDGHLFKVELDKNENTCKVCIGDVLSYDDKRRMKQTDVEINNIELKFNNVKFIKINKKIETKESSYNKIREWCTYKNMDDNYVFDLVCLTVDEPLYMTIVFSDVAVSYFNRAVN
ncbi:hypothetical protein acsn021_12110 [Anaerocolumna cellulosilytica]|uniref:Uncharacterized protein n=1 Tax=Anaerocolumna cellulosilytica TaxID=433286 RepID=A0A6S6R2C4_9FIRM|nr:hypothetical protein [Anaerocolumna cellulosilytica]MBB5196055.1 hypothetical protein [Anaerocolumna cellulosilytica]BCJ93642.1 hypothetical protein acsn021_12110 [Anaerocolumna cellulosilytica]